MAPPSLVIRTEAASSGPRALIRRHPIACYFALAYGISWIVWSPYVLSQNGLGIIHFRFPNILGDGQLAGLLLGAYLGPLSSAFIVTVISDGKPGLRRWVRRLLRWRVGWGWYAFALIGIPVVLVLGTLPLPGALATFHLPSPGLLLVYVPYLALQVVTTGVAEEPGWRDFALPRLQCRHGPLAGTLILGPLWAGWHLPLFLTDWAPNSDLVSIVEFLFMAIAFSIVITWVFNHTRESLPIAMLVHVTNNNVFSAAWSQFFPMLDPNRNAVTAALIAYGMLALLLVAATRGRLGYRGSAAASSPAASSRASAA